MKNKILVYDTAGGYKRFIKMNFNDEFDCESFFDYDIKEEIDYDQFVALFFFVNDPIQLVDLMRIYKKVNLAFLGTRIVKINESLKKLDDAVFLDLEQSRPQMLDCIKFNLRLFGVSE